MSSLTDPDVLQLVGRDFTIKVARVAVGSAFYGIYLILVYFLALILVRRGGFPGSHFLFVVTILLFLGCTLFLCLDIADLAARVQYLMIDNPGQNMQSKLADTDARLKKLVWTGYMNFVFLLALADTVLYWRTWKLFQDSRRYMVVPGLTLLGSITSAVFELGCHLKTNWEIPDLSPSASPVGAQACKDADLASYTLSFATNIICTLMIGYKAWQHRQVVNTYLGTLRRRTQAEKILVLLVESGAIYLILYVLQSIPIYHKGALPGPTNIAFNVVNAIIQQAMGLYPTAIIVIVQLNISVWEQPTISTGLFSTVNHTMEFSGKTTTDATVLSTVQDHDPPLSPSSVRCERKAETEKLVSEEPLSPV